MGDSLEYSDILQEVRGAMVRRYSEIIYSLL